MIFLANMGAIKIFHFEGMVFMPNFILEI